MRDLILQLSKSSIYSTKPGQSLKENADLYDYNRQVNRGWRGFILRHMGIHLPEKKRVCLLGINARKFHLSRLKPCWQ
jgi:hypothetical protein